MQGGGAREGSAIACTRAFGPFSGAISGTRFDIMTGLYKNAAMGLGGLYANVSRGLSNAKNIFTGAAPTPESLIYWFKKLDIHIQEAYAMTENCCYSHVTLNDAIKVGSVGKNLPLCDVKLSSENEILINLHVVFRNVTY